MRVTLRSRRYSAWPPRTTSKLLSTSIPSNRPLCPLPNNHTPNTSYPSPPANSPTSSPASPKPVSCSSPSSRASPRPRKTSTGSYVDYGQDTPHAPRSPGRICNTPCRTGSTVSTKSSVSSRPAWEDSLRTSTGRTQWYGESRKYRPYWRTRIATLFWRRWARDWAGRRCWPVSSEWRQMH